MTELQAVVNRLKADAKASAQWRGHDMGPWHDNSHKTAECHCLSCGRGVWVDAKPAPNGIDISGEAVALGCNKLRTVHVHEYALGRSGNVETCRCGAFRFTEQGLNKYPSVVEQKHVDTPEDMQNRQEARLRNERLYAEDRRLFPEGQ